MSVFLRGTCKKCRKPFFTSTAKCPNCKAPVDGIYWYKFRFKGERIEESTGMTNKKAAERLEQKRLEELRLGRAGLAPSGQPPLFEEYAASFLTWSKTTDSKGTALVHKPATQDMHEDNINVLLRYFSGRHLDEITPAMIESFKQGRIREKRQNGPGCVSGPTVNRALATLSLLFERAAQQSVFLGRNPVRGVDRFPERQVQRILSFQEQQGYLRHAGETLADFMVLTTEMGFRPQDLECLEIGNVMLATRILNLWPLSGAGETPKDGKTDAARRSVPISDDMLPIIQRRLEHARLLRTKWLFPSPRNPQKHITHSAVRSAHARALRKSGIMGRVRVYDLRHTGLTRLHESGVSDITLMRLAGHTKLQMTSRYIHISDEAKQDVVRKLEEYKRTHAIAEKAS